MNIKKFVPAATLAPGFAMSAMAQVGQTVQEVAGPQSESEVSPSQGEKSRRQ
jgi:hypothetical protein